MNKSREWQPNYDEARVPEYVLPEALRFADGRAVTTPVYRLLGLEGLPVAEPPPVNQPVMGTIGYHLREGKHDITEFDWKNYLDFADRHFA